MGTVYDTITDELGPAEFIALISFFTLLCNKSFTEGFGTSLTTRQEEEVISEGHTEDETPIIAVEAEEVGISSDTPFPTRTDLVRGILQLTEELGWVNTYKTDPGFYEFKKNGRYIPIILEDHMWKEKTKKGYLTTAGWKTDQQSMSWKEYSSWTSTNVTNYINNVNALGWVSFGRSPTRKRMDPVTLSMERVKEELKKFETIHE